MPQQTFIDRLRARPLHQRHIILWVGSFLIFIAIFWLWLLQLKVRLASITGSEFQKRSAVAAAKKPSEPTILGEISILIKNGAASLIGSFQKKEDNEPPPLKEGDELNKFLEEYKPFPK